MTKPACVDQLKVMPYQSLALSISCLCATAGVDFVGMTRLGLCPSSLLMVSYALQRSSKSVLAEGCTLLALSQARSCHTAAATQKRQPPVKVSEVGAMCVL